MRFRQVHLDFHTSEAIPGIGADFSKRQFQEMLKLGHVNSITLFSKCHHGWAYHPSEANETHPELKFDLLGEMIEAAHEIGVNTPVYLSAGLDEKLARRRVEWLSRDKEDRTYPFMEPGYHGFCMNTPYLDVLVSQVEEVVRNYDADGIFLDIVGVQMCYCQYCVSALLKQGQDPRSDAAVKALGESVYANYTNRIKEAVHAIKPGMSIFHNGGHIRRGRRDLARMNSHLELESLPTGGWGYDHFPLSARYSQTIGMPFLGMTGKFHTTWGEFGGYKHPNALRYETALSIANGAGCSIGDQLHPKGAMDEATYRLIGAAYREVEAKEPWCSDVRNVADVALLSLEAVSYASGGSNRKDGLSADPDAGAVRMLLEGKILFDVIDAEADFSGYKVLILPDEVTLDAWLAGKVNDYLSSGGKILATGRSGMNEAGDAFAVDLGVAWLEANPYRPDYFRPHFHIPELGEASFVFYSQGQKVALRGGKELGVRENPYFNRDVFRFCSHFHTPSSGEYGGPGMVESESGIYLAWNVFEEYASKGSIVLKETVLHALRLLLPDPALRTNLPAQGVVTLQRQDAGSRYINHLLYAVPVRRGKNTEVIEDIVPIHEVEVELRLPERAKRVYLAPQSVPLAFEQADDRVKYKVPRLECHQMVVVDV
ncbi:alpha-amylase family protein [Paenibacillus arenilitoris]|uniref:Beta-galactosidase trimerization domain-containing protein n=1 Tax=Paenibacillus arenilitoris TaxID=2772299 RepID=A0A927CL56_9BACL|nr:alpha-amylase family protein [Paenibacillus arenilitoris]MBD2867881.1 beta-galactosidase trimerization domain-containing protein [Paenibacillus arenilitoris]